jgi:hypothetical protein
VLDLVLAIEKVGDFDERTGVLRHDIGRVAIRDGLVERHDIAEPKAAAFDGKTMGGGDDIKVERR